MKTKLLMTALSIATVLSSASASAAAPIQLAGSQARTLTKAIQLLGAVSARVGRSKTLYTLRWVECDGIPMDTGGLPSYHCMVNVTETEPGDEVNGEVSSMLLYTALESANAVGEGHAGHFTYSAKTIQCSIDSNSGNSKCTIQQ